MTITEKIIALRTEKKIKSSEVAYALDMTQSNYARLEKRDKDLSINQLESIAVALGVTVDDILHYGEEKPQIVDNEKVKELENKVLLLEKDLEISRNRYELRTNSIISGLEEIFDIERMIERTSKVFFDDFVTDLIKTYLTNKTKLVKELNLLTSTIFLKYIVHTIKQMDNTFENSYNDVQTVIVFRMLNETEQLDFLQKIVKNSYFTIFVNFDWSEEKFTKILQDYNLIGYNQYDYIHNKEDITKLYYEKAKPHELITWTQLKGLKEYKENPLYKQTGFFRIDNL